MFYMSLFFCCCFWHDFVSIYIYPILTYAWWMSEKISNSINVKAACLTPLTSLTTRPCEHFRVYYVCCCFAEFLYFALEIKNKKLFFMHLLFSSWSRRRRRKKNKDEVVCTYIYKVIAIATKNIAACFCFVWFGFAIPF